jgi:MFS family permease
MRGDNMSDGDRKLNDSTLLRWSMLALMAAITFGLYYFNDIFSGLKSIIEVHLAINSDQFGTLLSSVSIANMFGMIILGGIILDKLGIRLTGLIFVCIASAGAFLVFLGGSGHRFGLMIVGMAMFGLGLETCCVMVQKVIVKWFKGKEMSLGFAVNMGVGRLGSGLTIMAGPVVAGGMVAGVYPGFARALLLGAVLVGIGLVMFAIYWGFDVRFDRQAGASADAAGADAFRLKDTWALLKNKAFLYITALCVLFYAAVFPFLNYVTDMLVNKFAFDLKTASRVSGLIPFGAIVFTLIFGRLNDKIGKGASMMIIGSVLLIFAHFTLSLTNLPPYIALFALGVAFSLVPAAMWPSVARIVPESRLGTAYAIMFTIQNYGLFTFKKLIGTVLHATNLTVTPDLLKTGQAHYNYTWAILLLVFCGLAGIVFALLLRREDRIHNYGLELPKRPA